MSSWPSSADGPGTIAFSRSVPIRIGPDGSYFGCEIGHFGEAPAVHAWKVMLRADGVTIANLGIGAVAGPEEVEADAFKATIVDERGTQSAVLHAIPGRFMTTWMPVTLKGGRVYDLEVQRLAPGPTVRTVHHYRLGSTDPRLEFGWQDPIGYLEPRSEWAFHTDSGETARIAAFVDSPAAEQVSQATQLSVEVFRPDGTFIVTPTQPTTPPIELAIPPSPTGSTFIVRVMADAHYRLRKAGGSDTGFYAMPCARPPGETAVAPPLAAPGQIGGGRGIWRVVGVGGGLAGFAALAVVAVGAWRRFARRTKSAGVETGSFESAPAAMSSPVQAPGNGDAAGNGLSAREIEVVGLIARGLTNRQISQRLVISQGTAKRHVENILQKLDLESRAQVAVWAARHGLASDGSPGAGNGRTPANGHRT